MLLVCFENVLYLARRGQRKTVPNILNNISDCIAFAPLKSGESLPAVNQWLVTYLVLALKRKQLMCSVLKRQAIHLEWGAKGPGNFLSLSRPVEERNRLKEIGFSRLCSHKSKNVHK